MLKLFYVFTALNVLGFGTRLRPLTFTMPKPLVDFANRPMIMHQIEALAKVGVKEIVLAVNYQPHVMVEAMKRVEEDYNIKVTFSLETEPLGTGKQNTDIFPEFQCV